MNTVRLFALVAGLTTTVASMAAAQSTAPPTPDSRWTPWMGCWHVAEESVQDAARLLTELAEGSPQSRTGSPGARVCVTPAANGGATVTTMANGNPIQEETIIADGRDRPISEPGCRGAQRAEWSALAARLYARAEISCNNQPTRIVSGLAAMVVGPMWLDIQMIESQGQKSLRVRRYHRAAQQPASLVQSAAGMPLASKLSIADIKEVNAKVPAEAVQAAVLELSDGGYDLKAKQLVELDDAGVPDSVIDLMIGMSFPKRFTVERASSGGGGGFAGYGNELDIWPYMAMMPYVGTAWPWYGYPYYGSSFYSPFYSAYYSSFYSPFGYRYWGYFDHGYNDYGGYGFVVVDSGGGGGGTVTPPSNLGEGRVVDGRGYTRVRRNEPEPAIRVNNGNGNGGWGTASTSSGGSSSGSGSSGVSSGGYSSGGSGGDRTAVPRPPGD
jgi:hypothetical protein